MWLGRERAMARDTPDGRSGRAAGKPVTVTYLERAAAFYLARYTSSAANLARVLARKARRRAGPDSTLGPEVAGWIDEVVAKAVRSGLVDDRSYAGAKLGSLLRRGASARGARMALSAKGIEPDIVAAAISDAAPDELAQARRYVERRHLGRWRSRPDETSRQRDLAALARAGFPYRMACAALDEDPEPGRREGQDWS